jgi:carbonic anhydrase/acetyltransferase-like protein (isoleucine patch superfamily)
MPVYEVNHHRPKIAEGAWIAPSAVIIGDVVIGQNCYIGFGAVIRGDFGPIVIGDETLIEENVVVHTATKTEIGSRVIVGHMAMIHDAVVHNGALVGMKAMLCEGSVIGKGAILAEQSLVLKNQRIPEGKIYAGSPAAYVKDVSDRHREMLDVGINAYMELIKRYHQTFKPI